VTNEEDEMTPDPADGAERSPLFILAFDHRGTFRRLLEGQQRPADEIANLISEAKRVVFDGYRLAMAEVPRNQSAILVDEEFGADIAREARAEGYVVAMPVEASGHDVFQFDYGENFRAHIEAFDPDYAKVLVRWNPEGDLADNERQASRLRELSAWLADTGRRLLFELVLVPTASQLERVGDDAGRFDRELRGELTVRAMEEVQSAGIEPRLWKLEGLETRDECVAVGAQARANGRDDVTCVVLGRGAGDGSVRHWLATSAGVPGFVGFAIGRTIFWDVLVDWLDGRATRDVAEDTIATKYRQYVEFYGSQLAVAGTR
jgi:myo-inositol catabolism protein IolC